MANCAPGDAAGGDYSHAPRGRQRPSRSDQPGVNALPFQRSSTALPLAAARRRWHELRRFAAAARARARRRGPSSARAGGSSSGRGRRSATSDFVARHRGAARRARCPRRRSRARAPRARPWSAQERRVDRERARRRAHEEHDVAPPGYGSSSEARASRSTSPAREPVLAATPRASSTCASRPASSPSFASPARPPVCATRAEHALRDVEPSGAGVREREADDGRGFVGDELLEHGVRARRVVEPALVSQPVAEERARPRIARGALAELAEGAPRLGLVADAAQRRGARRRAGPRRRRDRAARAAPPRRAPASCRATRAARRGGGAGARRAARCRGSGARRASLPVSSVAAWYCFLNVPIG